MSIRLLAAVMLMAAIGPPRAGLVAQTMTVVSWNLESGGANPDTVANHMGLHFGTVDVWGFTEVSAGWVDALRAGAEGTGAGLTFGAVVGTTGGADRMVILYNEDRFDLQRTEELGHINIGGNVRAPLVATLLDQQSGAEFSVMVNHLYRSNGGARREQSRLLNAWAAAQDGAVIAVGDYNYDWETIGGDTDHDPGYDSLVANGTFEWVRPATLIRTQCSVRVQSDGTLSCRYDSVLDFVFVSGDAQDWPATATIMTWDGDFPDDHLHPDHRPVLATFTVGGAAPPVVDSDLRTRLLERLDILEQEIAAIRALLGG